MKTALLIIDMQEHFRSMTSTALPNILKLASHFKKADLPIIFTQHGHPPADFKEPITNQVVRKWGEASCIKTGSSDWKLMSEVAALQTPDTPYYLIHKNVYDAFLSPSPSPSPSLSLEPLLASQYITRLVICGVMTDCCIDTTARSAFNRGFETWVVGDACASQSVEQHVGALKGLEIAYGVAWGVEGVLEALGMVENEEGEDSNRQHC